MIIFICLQHLKSRTHHVANDPFTAPHRIFSQFYLEDSLIALEGSHVGSCRCGGPPGGLRGRRA